MSTETPKEAKPTPQFVHDSTCCAFVGRSADGTHDLYVCSAKTASTKDRTYIARYGNDGPEYTSCIDIILDSYAADHPEAFKYCVEARKATGAQS